MGESGKGNGGGPKDLLGWLGVTGAPNWRIARALGPLIAVLLMALFVLALMAAFAVVVSAILQAAQSGTSGPNLGAGALIAAVLGAPFLIWGTWLKHRTVSFQKEGHITDRINKAVEMLGAEKTVKVPKDDGTVSMERTVPNIEVRIGAILSLERIAQDSTAYDKGRDHVRVMEILCAYIRENAPASDAWDFPLPEWVPPPDDADEAALRRYEAWRTIHFRRELVHGSDYSDPHAFEWVSTPPRPRVDIGIALAVLGRRNIEQRRVEAAWPEPPDTRTTWAFDVPCPEFTAKGDVATAAEIQKFRDRLAIWKKMLDDYSGYRLDLRNTNLQGADFSDLAFSGALLDGAPMDWANLTGARFEGVDLSRALLRGALLTGARVQCADLSAAQLETASISDAKLQGAMLWNAGMQRVGASCVQMQGVVLSGALLDGTNFTKAGLEGATFGSARVYGANFRGARLEGADLRQAQIRGGVSLRDAVLDGAVLRELELQDIKMSPEQLSSTFCDASIVLPQGMQRPKHWPDWVLPWQPNDPNNFDAQYRLWQENPGTYIPPLPPE